MAQELDTFTKKPGRTYHSALDGWLDGRRWRLTLGEDAKTPAELENLRRNLYRRGKRLHKRVRIVVFPDALEVQAILEP